MESLQDYSFAKEVDHPIYEIFCISFMALAWAVFSLSAVTYKHFYWFDWLYYSRITMALLGFLLVIVIIRYKLFSKNLASVYLLLSIGIQATHGYFEGSKSVDFYNFIGIVFVLANLSYNGYLKKWIQYYLPINILFFSVPLFFKDQSYFSSVQTFISNFDLMISGLIIGFGVVILTSSRYAYADKYLKTKIELGNVATQVAHDIKSPLEVLKIILDSDISLPKEEKEIVLESINRIDNISRNLILKNLHPEKELPILVSTCNVSDVISNVVKQKSIEINKKKNVSITLKELSSQPCISTLDSSEFKSILSNIVNNSADAIKDKGDIEIRIFQDESIHIQVEDNGIGIDPQILNKLFKKGASFNKSNGMGVGLYYAKEKIQSWGGDINISSVIGKGTVLSIRLPLKS